MFSSENIKKELLLRKKRADPNLPIQKLLVLFQLGNQRISFLDDLQAQTLL